MYVDITDQVYELYQDDEICSVLQLNYNHINELTDDDMNSKTFKNAKCLYLKRNNIKTLPKSIKLMIALTQLHIEGNNLSSLPDEIGDLKLLEVLNVVSNGLTSIPPSIGELKGLKKLQISMNKIRCLPNEIGNLQCLETLEASSNNLFSVPVSLINCTQLKLLALDKNRLKLFPRQLCRLKKLTELSLAGNQFEYLPPMIFHDLSSLGNLVIDQNPLITAYPPHPGNIEISHFGISRIDDCDRDRFQHLIIQGKTISMPEEFSELCRPGKSSVPCLQELTLRSLHAKLDLQSGNLGDLLSADLADTLMFPTGLCHHCRKALFISAFPVIYKENNTTLLTSAFCCSVKCIVYHDFKQDTLLYPPS